MIRKNEKSYLWRGILSAEWSGQTIGPLDQTLVKNIGQDTCLAVKASQKKVYHIRISVQHQKRKFILLPASRSRFGSASRRHSKASFSQWPSGRIRRRLHILVRWHALRPAWWSLATRTTNAFKCVQVPSAYHWLAAEGDACSYIEV
jgi:hypothetical protein